METLIRQQHKQVGYRVLDQICKTLLANSKTYLSPNTYTKEEIEQANRDIPWALRDWSYEANGEYEVGSVEEQAIFERNRNA